MEISKQEKMQVLLKQLQMPAQHIEKYFQQSKLDKLEVFKQTKIWHFHIHIKRMLPVTIYELLIGSLQSSFQDIAKVDLTLYTEDKTDEETKICDYWHHFLQSIPDLSP